MKEKVSIPRPEYPRPQLVRSEWLNLNGEWEFEFDAGLCGEEKGFHQQAPFTQNILVPFAPESELSGIGQKDFMPCVWYRRKFTLPDEWQEKRICLHFGAVDYEATVWVNGSCAGTHLGGYAPFSFEVTHLLKRGENAITVRAVDDTRSGLQPRGKQSPKLESYRCLYTRTTGLWQTVWLEPLPAAFLRSFRFFPDIHQGKITILANVDGDTEGLLLKTKIFASGKEVGSAEIRAASQMLFTIPLADVHLWQPESPFLYDVEFSLEKDGAPLDRVQSYFGLRQVSIQGKKVLLNDKSVFQRLVLDQGYYPDGIYTAPSDEALRKDIELAMAMGFNGARLHQKVFEPRFLYWADRLGYLVWGEYPNWGLDHSHARALQRMLPEWLEVLQRDFNHPSIIGWCPFNETSRTQNPELLRNIYRVTKAVDPTRPVIDTSGYVHTESDIYDCHSYEQDVQKFAAFFEDFKTGEEVWRNQPEHNAPYQGQPYFVSEYGGIWWNPGQIDEKAWGYGRHPETEEEFLKRYRGLTETLLFHPKMFGFCYTQLYDIEQEVNGLYTYEREPKFSPEIIKRINSQVAAIERD
jgi:beta-galactosidase/beta-glucuronidase